MRANREMIDPAPISPEPRTLVQLLSDRAKHGERSAAGYKRDGTWHQIPWTQVLEQVQTLSEGLVALGVAPGDRVAIFAATSLGWVVADLAISAAQAITVPIYPSNTPDECRYILSNSQTKLVFVDNDEKDAKQAGRLTRLREKIGQCPSVEKVVIFEGKPAGAKELALPDVIQTGAERRRKDPSAYEARVAKIKPQDTSHIIYTSGTTGDPKGVLLTHRNWGYEAQIVRTVDLIRDDDAVMLFLPLAHVFAQVIKAAWLSLGFTMYFAESVDKLMANLIEVHPTILPSVPRIFERVYNGVIANGMANGGLKGRLFQWAFKLFDEYAEARSAGRAYQSPGFTLAKKLVFSKVKAGLDEKLGGRMRLFVSGGAPLSKKIAFFFDLLGFKVLEGYGLTETSAATFVNPPDAIRIGTVGPVVPGTETKIAPDGEILVRGPGVMTGYYQNPAATAEVLEADGWFHTGDIGELDSEGYLKITDRKKDIIVTANGKKIPPQNLENQLKTYPLISQAMVHGDKRKYLSALICISEEPARKLLTDAGVPGGTYAEMAAKPEVRRAVEGIIDQVNAEQPPHAQIKRFALIDHDFTQESGELTPSLKVKRKVCVQRYKAILDGLYDGEVVE